VTPILARAGDRANALAQVRARADFVTRKTGGSAHAAAAEAPKAPGARPETIAAVMAELRRRDAGRSAHRLSGDIPAGRDLLAGNAPQAGRRAAAPLLPGPV
jgi:hypothetical protein